jgi:hypothetical protein
MMQAYTHVNPLPMQNNVILVASVFAFLWHASNPLYILGTSYGLLSKYK